MTVGGNRMPQESSVSPFLDIAQTEGEAAAEQLHRAALGMPPQDGSSDLLRHLIAAHVSIHHARQALERLEVVSRREAIDIRQCSTHAGSGRLVARVAKQWVQPDNGTRPLVQRSHGLGEERGIATQVESVADDHHGRVASKQLGVRRNELRQALADPRPTGPVGDARRKHVEGPEDLSWRDVAAHPGKRGVESKDFHASYRAPQRKSESEMEPRVRIHRAAGVEQHHQPGFFDEARPAGEYQEVALAPDGSSEAPTQVDKAPPGGRNQAPASPRRESASKPGEQPLDSLELRLRDPVERLAAQELLGTVPRHFSVGRLYRLRLETHPRSVPTPLQRASSLAWIRGRRYRHFGCATPVLVEKAIENRPGVVRNLERDAQSAADLGPIKDVHERECDCSVDLVA